MERVITILLSCVLLTASSLQASSVEETYQAALTQEKGEGNLEEAIRLYKQVIEAHEKGEGDEKMAARAQLRIGVCQEKQGLAQARQTYEAVRDKYPESQEEAEATRRLESAHQREATMEDPSSLTASESAIRLLLPRSEQWPSLIVGADSTLINERVRRIQDAMGRIDSVFVSGQLETLQQQLEILQQQLETLSLQPQITEQTKRQTEQTERPLEVYRRRQLETLQQQINRMEQAKWRTEQAKQIIEQAKRTKLRLKQTKLGTSADSVFIDEQVRRQLKAFQWQMEQAERQMKQQQIEWQNQQTRSLPSDDDLLEHWNSLGMDLKTAIKKSLRRATDKALVAEMPIKWKFHLDPDMKPMERTPRFHEYAVPDFDDSEWADIKIGRPWAEQGHADYEGGAWYRAKFAVAADRVRPVHIYIEGKYRTIEVYINGHLIAFHGSFNITERPFIADIGPMTVRDGENTVALYVYGGTDMASIDRINVYQPIVNYWASLGSEKEAGQQYSPYANSPAVVPYSHKKVAKVPTQWKFRLDERRLNPRRDREYAAPGLDDSEWADIKIGQAWEAQGYAGYNGGAWYRTQIRVDAKEGQPVHLAFGGVDQHATLYVNGHWVGEHNKWSRPFILDISDQVMRDGENTVALYVFDGEGMGGIYGTVKVVQPTKEENLDRYLANRNGATW